VEIDESQLVLAPTERFAPLSCIAPLHTAEPILL
jgi:hypothetical protein